MCLVCYVLLSVLFLWLQDKEDPFYMVDLGRLLLLHDTWQQSLPGVQPFYAVKCNNDPTLLQIMASLGCGFDCASKVSVYRELTDEMVL